MYKRIGDDVFDISRLLDINRPPLLKMKLIIVVALALVAVVAAAPQTRPEPPKILRSEFDQQPEGAYQFGFETEDGIVRNEAGELKQALDEDNKPHDVIVVRGSYSYKDPTGQEVTIHYTADETGFHAEGDSIPKAARK